jgi:hypothetical protein
MSDTTEHVDAVSKIIRSCRPAEMDAGLIAEQIDALYAAEIVKLRNELADEKAWSAGLAYRLTEWSAPDE